MPRVVNRTSPLGRLERAIKDREVIVLNMRRPFNSSSSVNVTDDRISLLMRVSQLEQSRRHSIVNNLNHPPTNELLVLNQSQIRLNPRRVAVHHEAYGACGGQDCDLGIAVAVFFAVGQGFVPALFAGFEERRGDVAFIDSIH